MSYANDRAWSDSYLPTVKAIVGPRLLEPAPLERDMHEATDLIVMRARDMTIAVRLRRPGFAEKYPRQITLRCKRDSGAKTELAKIVEGWGDWFFYGHVSGPTNILPWYLIDLHVLRATFIRNWRLLHQPDGIAAGDTSNGDGTYFRWFSLDHLPAAVLIGCGEPAARAA